MLKAVATVSIISIITRALAFVFKIYLSRELGAEILGVYQICMSIFILIASLSSSGLPTTLSRKTAEYGMLGDSKSEKQILATTVFTSLFLSVASMLFFYLFPNITALLFSDSRCTDMFVTMLPALISTSVYSVTRGWFWGKKDYLVFSSSELVQEVLSIAIVAMALLSGIFRDKSRAIAVAFVVSDYIATAILVILFFRKGGRLARPAKFGEVYRSALPLTSSRLLGSLVSSLMALLIPSLLVKYGMDTSLATASYGRASGMVMPLLFAPSSFTGSLAVVMIPELASSNIAKKPSVSSTVKNAIFISVMSACVFVPIYMSLGEEICSTLYHDDIAGSFLTYASVLMIPLSINQMVISLLNTLGKENKTFLSHMIGSALLFAMILILPKYIGIHAYFVGLISFHVFTMSVNLITLSKTTKLGKQLFLNSSLVIAFACLTGVLLNFVDMPSVPKIAAIAIKSAIAVSTYLLFLIVFKFIDITKFLKKRKKPVKTQTQDA